jgi:acyl carrier protein
MPETQSKDQIQERVISALVEFGEERENLKLDARFEDLDIDSLDLVELAQIAEDDYGVLITTEDLKRIETVGQAVDLIVERAA